MMLQTMEKYYRVDRREISFIKFIFEACDGIVTLSTVDAAMGIVRFAISPGCEKDFNQVLSDLKQYMRIEAWPNMEQEPV